MPPLPPLPVLNRHQWRSLPDHVKGWFRGYRRYFARYGPPPPPPPPSETLSPAPEPRKWRGRPKPTAAVNHALTFTAGGMTPLELGILEVYCRGADVLEIGSLVGQSSYVIASVAKSIVCVDAWDDTFCERKFYGDRAKGRLVDVEGQFDRNLAGFTNVTKIKGLSSDAAKTLAGRQFDVVLIDGDHGYRGCKHDLRAFRSSLEGEGGIMLVHDYGSSWAGVKKAALEILGKPEELDDTLAMWRILPPEKSQKPYAPAS
jgi:hypothetical protein